VIFPDGFHQFPCQTGLFFRAEIRRVPSRHTVLPFRSQRIRRTRRRRSSHRCRPCERLGVYCSCVQWSSYIRRRIKKSAIECWM
jgi:hypothetical protein